MKHRGKEKGNTAGRRLMGDSSDEILSTRPALDKLLQPKLKSAQA